MSGLQAIQTLTTLEAPVPVHCARSGYQGSGGRSRREAVKHALVLALLDCGDGASYGLPAEWPSSTVRLSHGPSGNPRLLIDGSPGPSVSFSHLPDVTWAVLARANGGLGIDAARPEEFGAAYPLHRVFHSEEMRCVMERTGTNQGEAAALLWSVKEAVVKVLGCGFGPLDPLDIRIDDVMPGMTHDVPLISIRKTPFTELSAKMIMRTFTSGEDRVTVVYLERNSGVQTICREGIWPGFFAQ